MPNAKLLAVIPSIAALLITPAWAWNDQGHMMVAAVAYDQLTPPTRARVAQPLALSDYPTNGRNNASAIDQAKAKFIMAATAPDAIKRDITNFANEGQNPVNAPDAARNTGFDDPNIHEYWHYVDLPLSPDGTQIFQPPAIKIAERITLFRQTLSDTSDGLKAYDLVWLLHSGGDTLHSRR